LEDVWCDAEVMLIKWAHSVSNLLHALLNFYAKFEAHQC